MKTGDTLHVPVLVPAKCKAYLDFCTWRDAVQDWLGFALKVPGDPYDTLPSNVRRAVGARVLDPTLYKPLALE